MAESIEDQQAEGYAELEDGSFFYLQGNGFTYGTESQRLQTTLTVSLSATDTLVLLKLLDKHREQLRAEAIAQRPGDTSSFSVLPMRAPGIPENLSDATEPSGNTDLEATSRA